MKIKEIARVVNGATPSTKNPEYYDGGIVWATPKDLSNQDSKFFFSGERTISAIGLKSCAAEIIPAGNILMSSRAPIGLIAINKVDCCTNQGFKSLVLNHDLCDVNYMYYYMKHHLKEIEALGSGTTFKEISKSIFEQWEVALPVLEKQKKIGNVLTVIDEKIEINRAISINLEKLTKIIYNYWFVQFDFPNENGRPYKSSGGKIVWNEDLNRYIPNGWNVVRIGDIITSERGITYSTKNIKTKTGIPMINLASFQPGKGCYKHAGIKYYQGDYPQGKVLKPFDLIMCNTQQTAINFNTDIIGRAMLVPDIFDSDVVYSHHVTAIKPRNKNIKLYLLNLFNSNYFHKYISGFTNGTNILGLLFNGVEDYLIEVPPDSLLEKFNDIEISIEKQKSEIMKENIRLSSLRDFLLPLLMNGQLTFNNK